jgi:hypothetical protein
VDQVLHRAQLFAGFRRALEQTPDQALRDYELCACETAAIRTRDIDALVALGVAIDFIAWWCIVLPQPVVVS